MKGRSEFSLLIFSETFSGFSLLNVAMCYFSVLCPKLNIFVISRLALGNWDGHVRLFDI